jgi:hypothetical protein
MKNDFLPRRGQRDRLRPGHRAAPSWERPHAFRTPEAIAAEEEQNPVTNTTAGFNNHGANKYGAAKQKGFKAWLKRLSKKQRILLIAAIVLVLASGGFAVYYFFFKPEPAKPAVIVKKEIPPPPAGQPLVSSLTGLPISDATINQRPVTGVMIENSPDARPQSGLNQAGVVFEAVAEGGITRFLTLFQDSEPDYIGPIRSVRPYYVIWATGFDAGIAHVGGSADALKMLRQDHVTKDLDQFFNPGPYHRVSNRYAPHNMYSSVTALREMQQQKGYTSTYTGFARKPEAKSAAPNATSMDFNISGAIYNPHYDYDAATNTYKRSEGGKPHIDEKSGQQLSPKVVVALVMPQGRNGIYTTYNTLGSGEAFIFQDGTVGKATWHKPGYKDQMTFTDGAGAPVKFNPGQTWLSVVGSTDRVSYK